MRPLSAAFALTVLGLSLAPQTLAQTPEAASSDSADLNLEPDPYDQLPDRLDEDEGEPRPLKRLPPEGEAFRPTMPFIDRDLVQPRSFPAGRNAAQLGFARIDEDLFLELTLSTIFDVGKWRISPRLPLRFRIQDRAPETNYIIREEDWDEASDWARILAFIQFGSPEDPVLLRYGELTGVTIGHGSLVNRYFNTIDIDHYHGGIYSSFDVGLAGGEVLLNDVFDPNVFAIRGFNRPFFKSKSLSLPLRGLKFGLSFAIDASAPTAIYTADEGLFTNSQNEPIVLAKRALPMASLDLEVPVISNMHMDLVPYFDIATLDFNSIGTHMGAFLKFRFTPEDSLRLRAEYRFIGARHEAGYISPFYEIERFSYLDGQPKLQALRLIEHDEEEALGEAHHGIHLEADLRIHRVIDWSLIFTSTGHSRHNDILSRVRLPHLGPLRLTLFYARLGFAGFSDMFAADQTLGGVSARVALGSFFIRGRVLSEWRLSERDNGTRAFETVLNWDIGGGLLFRL